MVKGAPTASASPCSLEKGATVDTNTYFGRFAASYWQRWTDGHRGAAASGSATWPTARRGARCRGSDIGGHSPHRRDDADRRRGHGRRCRRELDAYLDGGSLWVEFEAPSAASSAVERTGVDRRARRRLIRPVAIAICTFNRADDCAETVAAHRDRRDVARGIDAVYVVDQGTDHVAGPRAVHRGRARSSATSCVYLRQPNLGGAGGFTRGMYEVVGHQRARQRDPDGRRHPVRAGDRSLRLNAFANVTTRADAGRRADAVPAATREHLHVGAEEVRPVEAEGGPQAAGALRHDVD